MRVFMFAVMSLYFKESPVISHLPEIAFDYVIKQSDFKFGKCSLIYRFQSVDSLGKLATIVGTASDF